MSFLIHKSIYHLKEADLHTWAIPRLSGAVKAALVTIQSDEYGAGCPEQHARPAVPPAHAALAGRRPIRRAPAPCARRHPAGQQHHLDVRSASALARRPGGPPDAVRDDVLAPERSLRPRSPPTGRRRTLGAVFRRARSWLTAVHEQLAAHDLAGGLVRDEPQLGRDIIFGARCAGPGRRTAGHPSRLRVGGGPEQSVPHR